MGGSSQMSQGGMTATATPSSGDPFMQGHEPAGPGPSSFGIGSTPPMSSGGYGIGSTPPMASGGNMLSSPPPTAAGTTPPINSAPVGMTQPQTPQISQGMAPQQTSPFISGPIAPGFSQLGNQSGGIAPGFSQQGNMGGMFGNNQFQEILQMLMRGGEGA